MLPQTQFGRLRKVISSASGRTIAH